MRLSMKLGVTLIECMIYLAGSALVALLVSSFVIALIAREKDGILTQSNNYLACQAVLQALTKDSRHISRGRGRLTHADMHRCTIVLPDETISWSSHASRIIRTTTKRGEKPVSSSMASKNAQLCFAYEYGADTTIMGAWITVSVACALLKRYICLRNRCSFLL